MGWWRDGGGPSGATRRGREGRTSHRRDRKGLLGELMAPHAPYHAELEPRPDGLVATERCNGYALRQTLAHLSKSHSDSAPAPAGGGLAVSALLDRLTLNFGLWQVSWRVWPCL
jgi:hypothetical protein